MWSSSSPRMRMKEERDRRHMESKRRILRGFLEDLKANPYSDGDQTRLSSSKDKRTATDNASRMATNAYRAAYNDVCVDEALIGRELPLNIYYADVAGVCAAIERRVLETTTCSAVPPCAGMSSTNSEESASGNRNGNDNNGDSNGNSKGQGDASLPAGMEMMSDMNINMHLPPSSPSMLPPISMGLPVSMSFPIGIPMPMGMMTFAPDMMSENMVKMYMMRCTNERLSARKLSPLHVCVLGARLSLRVFGFRPDVLTNYHAIAQLLLITGSDVNARDALGATPLMHAIGYGSSPISRALVPLFISWGAQVNTLDRFGTDALSVAIAAGDIPSYTLLCHAGASFNQGNRGGEYYLKKSKAHLRQLLNGIRKDADARRKISTTLCDYCMCAGATKKCGWCRRVSYCSRECQLLDWKRLHENSCKAWQRRLDNNH